MPIYNFTQVHQTTWRVQARDSIGDCFNFYTADFPQARERFLRAMWGGKHRPDRLSFEDWKKTVTFSFLYEEKVLN